MNVDNDVLDTLWISNEPHFHLTSFVNKQNNRYWADRDANKLK